MAPTTPDGDDIGWVPEAVFDDENDDDEKNWRIERQKAACPQIAQDGYPLWLPRRLIKNYPPWMMKGPLDPEL